MKRTFTKAIIYAAANDAYSARKRRGLPLDQCSDAYHAEFERLFQIVGGPEGWMDLSDR